jgi:hypothetical protein
MIDEHVNRVFKQTTTIPPPSPLTLKQQNNKKTSNKNDLQTTLNNTCGSYLNPTNIPSTLMSTSKSFLNKTNYQLMAQCSKEVDIDQQQQQQHHQYRSSNFNNNNHQHHHHHHDQNYDSGVSTRSVASIERVSDWLATSNCNNYQPTAAVATPTPILTNNVKTTVAYYLPGEDVAYISSFNGTMVTLAQFKQLITKKGQFR